MNVQKTPIFISGTNNFVGVKIEYSDSKKLIKFIIVHVTTSGLVIIMTNY